MLLNTFGNQGNWPIYARPVAGRKGTVSIVILHALVQTLHCGRRLVWNFQIHGAFPELRCLRTSGMVMHCFIYPISHSWPAQHAPAFGFLATNVQLSEDAFCISFSTCKVVFAAGRLVLVFSVFCPPKDAPTENVSLTCLTMFDMVPWVKDGSLIVTGDSCHQRNLFTGDAGSGE